MAGVGLTRVAKTRSATISHTFYVDESPTDATGSVTYAVTDANGASVASGTATHGVTGVYSFTLASQTTLKLLSVAWSGTIAGAAVTETEQVEVVGGFFFGLAEARNSDSTLADGGKYTTAAIIAKRLEVEQEAEEICDRAFVPRYRRVVLDGDGSAELVLPDPDIRTIRSVTMASRLDETFTALTTAQLAALAVGSDSTLRRVDGLTWTDGRRNVVVEYEFGLDAPPSEVKTASLTRLRSRLNMNRTSIPDRASSFTVTDQGTYRLDMPGAWKTGIPEVDAAYARYSLRDGAGGRTVPASRTLNFDPQRGSLFHGGVR